MGDRRRDALLQIGLAIGSTVDIDALLNVVMGHVTALLSAERSTLYLVDQRRWRGLSWREMIFDPPPGINLALPMLVTKPPYG